ncbi:hypothetical protein GZL_09289 [Streptomyces sp. 769]|nr:hypothetical protein GZL_09289 [Streptomyces sp. 769]
MTVMDHILAPATDNPVGREHREAAAGWRSVGRWRQQLIPTGRVGV